MFNRFFVFFFFFLAAVLKTHMLLQLCSHFHCALAQLIGAKMEVRSSHFELFTLTHKVQAKHQAKVRGTADRLVNAAPSIFFPPAQSLKVTHTCRRPFIISPSFTVTALPNWHIYSSLPWKFLWRNMKPAHVHMLP